MSHRRFLVCLAVIVAAGFAYRHWTGRLGRVPVEELLATGDTLQREGRHEEAIRHFTAALSKDPLNARALTARAFSYAQTVQGPLALQDLEGAIRVSHGTYRKSFLLRAFMLHIAGYYELALADANRAIELDESMANGYLLRSIVYRTPGKGDLAKAKQDYDKAVSLAPEYKELVPGLATFQ